jgi:hypothetical protein
MAPVLWMEAAAGTTLAGAGVARAVAGTILAVAGAARVVAGTTLGGCWVGKPPA